MVCPDCGAPYHRVCYEKLGQCIHRPAHAAGYEWKFPYEESQLRTCPSCGERTLRDEETCRCCGAVLPPEGQEPPSFRDSGEETFDYSQMYRQFGTSADPEKEFFEDAFGKEAKMDGIDRQDWLDYIGPAAPAYLAAYSRMQLQKSKVSMSFSVLAEGVETLLVAGIINRCGDVECLVLAHENDSSFLLALTAKNAPALPAVPDKDESA